MLVFCSEMQHKSDTNRQFLLLLLFSRKKTAASFITYRIHESTNSRSLYLRPISIVMISSESKTNLGKLNYLRKRKFQTVTAANLREVS